MVDVLESPFEGELLCSYPKAGFDIYFEPEIGFSEKWGKEKKTPEFIHRVAPQREIQNP